MNKKFFGLTALLVTAAVTLSACGGGASKQAAAPAGASPAGAKPVANKPVRIGYINVMDDAPVMLAADAGLYEKYGLDAKLQLFSSGTDLIKAIVGGQLDVGVLGFTNAVAWASKGADLKVVGGAQIGYHSLLVQKDSPIKTVADLKGHTLASQDKGTTADIVLNGVVLPGANLSRTDVNMVYLSPSVALQSLASDKVDGAFVFEPYASIARAGGNVREIYEVGKVWPFPCMVVITSGKVLGENRTLIETVLEAQKDAINMLEEKPADSAKLLTSRFIKEESVETPSGKVPAVEVVRQAIEHQDFNWAITDEQIARMNEIADMMKKQGALTESIDLTKVLDLSWQQQHQGHH